MLFQPSVGSSTPYLPSYLEARERIIFGILFSLVSQGRESKLERLARTKKKRIIIFLFDL